jgi:hypothetical protein
MSEREGLAARVRQMRRAAAITYPQPAAGPGGEAPNRVDVLEARVTQLEGLLEGLQDSVHRESLRQCDRIAELEARIEPSVLAVSLSTNARERGL